MAKYFKKKYLIKFIVRLLSFLPVDKDKINLIVFELSLNLNIKSLIRYRTTFPMWWWLSIDLHSYCNRDCEYCPRYYDRSGIRKDENGKKIRKKMPTEKVYSIINQASKLGFKGIVRFHRFSEPLLDSRYLEFAIYVKKMGMKLHDDTNGDVLKNNPDLCSKLDGILDLIKIHLSDHKNHSEMNQEKIYWRSKFRKTKVRFSTPSEQQMIMQNSKTYYETEKDPKCIDSECLWPYYDFQIRYDGNVELCCEDDQCSFKLGNVFEQPLEEILWSKKHLKIVRTLTKPGGKHHFELCRNCYLSAGILKKKNGQYILIDEPIILKKPRLVD